MSIDSRVKNLERRAGIGGDTEACICGPSASFDIRTYIDAEDNHAAADADERPPEVCEVCGRPRGIIKLIVVHTREQAARVDARA